MESDAHRPLPVIGSRRLFSDCSRHPDQQVTGFCASCLRERLSRLDHAASAHGRSSTSSAVPKSISFRSFNGANVKPSSTFQHQNGLNKNSISSLRMELRRCKSFAGGSRADAEVEPQRKSCDVRVRNTLWSLFHQDDHERIANGSQSFLLSSSASAASVFSSRGNRRVQVNSAFTLKTSKEEMEDARPMKDHMDQVFYSQTKKVPSRDLKEIAGSFWLAASFFGKKLKIWPRRHKENKSITEDDGVCKAFSDLRPLEGKIPNCSRLFTDTQSEIAVDSLGRRSCDIAPRFSLDASRISFDDQKCLWNEHRVGTWERHFFNSDRSVQRSDCLIPVEEGSTTPGCSAQTRDYYSDSNRRRFSLDRSSSTRKHSVELCNTRSVSNGNIPELFHWKNLEQESKLWASNSLREDCTGRFDSTAGFRDPIHVRPAKKSRHWSFWGLIHGRNGSRTGGPQVMERSFSETWPELKSSGFSRSESARRSFSSNGGVTSTLKKKKNKKKKKVSNEVVVDNSSRSTRYSPNQFDSGLLRFYLTPMRGSRRSGLPAKNKFRNPQSFNSSVIRLY